MSWQPVEGCNYLHDYGEIFEWIRQGRLEPLSTYRELCKKDLFFLLRFGLAAPYVEKPFVVDRCREIQEGPRTRTLDLWAREHFKCLAEGTEVVLPDGRTRPIEALQPGDAVMGYTPMGESTPTLVRAVAGPYRRRVVRIRTAGGREIRTSLDHRLVTVTGVVEARHLRVGHKIAVQRVLRLAGGDPLGLEQAELLGYLAGAWGLTVNGPTRVKVLYPDTVVQDVVENLGRLGRALGFVVRPGDVVIKRGRGRAAVVRVFLEQGPRDPFCLAVFVHRHGLMAPKEERRIPSSILGGSMAVRDAFLGAFMATCAYVVRDKQDTIGDRYYIDFRVQTEAMQKSLSMLLATYGVGWRRRVPRASRPDEQYVMRVERGAAILACAPVPGRKAAAFQEVAERGRSASVRLPKEWLLLVPEKLRGAARARARELLGLSRKSQSPPPPPLPPEVARVLAYEFDVPALHLLAGADFGWDKIVEVEGPEEAWCYDIQVGESQLFVADGVVSHNSTILTYAEPIQDLVRNPEERIAIISYNRPVAKAFLRQIKLALEGDIPIKSWFPDIFYADPVKESPKWSEDEGLLVRRSSFSREMSIEAWGLVDSQPIGRHFTKIMYDDVVTTDTVRTVESMRKVKEAFELSHSVGTEDGRHRVAGTHYAYDDLYMDLRKSGRYHTRIHPVWDPETKKPVLVSEERLKQLMEQQSPYVFSCQQLLEPTNPEAREFLPEQVRRYRKLPTPLQLYLLVDPANAKKKHSDETAMAVVGLDLGGNVFLVDAVLDKLGLLERWKELKRLAVKWRPLRIGYEEYGLQADIEFMEHRQLEEGVYLPPIRKLGGKTKKEDRIRWLAPDVNDGRFFVPESGLYYKGRDLVAVLLEQMAQFPNLRHDDFIDCVSRIRDKALSAEKPEEAYRAPWQSDDADIEEDLDRYYDMV